MSVSEIVCRCVISAKFYNIRTYVDTQYKRLFSKNFKYSFWISLKISSEW